MTLFESAHRHGVRNRRGAVMIAVLVCLLLVSMLVTSLLHSALNSRRQLRMEHHARQAMLLLQAGAEHARAQLDRDGNYKGETLQLQIPDRSAAEDGEIAIQAEPVHGQNQTRVQITARYPLDSPQLVQRSLNLTFPQSTR